MFKKLVVYEEVDSYDECCCDCHGHGEHLQERELTTADEVAAFLADFFQRYENQEALSKLLDNQYFALKLQHQGWRDVKSIKDAKEKIIAGTRFYTYEPRGWGLHEVKPTKVRPTDAHSLAKPTTLLLQEIDKQSLKELCPEVWKHYQKAKKEADEAEAKKKAQAEARKKKQKAKKLEAAKKLLKEAGELE